MANLKLDLLNKLRNDKYYEELEKRADLEKETVEEIRKILKAELDSEE